MYGWRAKVGVLVPDGNSTMEPELYRLAPPGVSFHFARLQASPHSTTLKAIIRDYVASAAHAAEAVARVEPDLIVFGLTAGSFVPDSGGNVGIAAMADGVQGIYRLRPERVYREVKMALQGQEVDGIFLSGTGIHSLDIISLLEADLGLPVVSSNTAVLWSVLRRLGITPLPGGGRLMQQTCRGDARVEA